MPATDLHQHLWPEALVRLLERRSAAPRLRHDDRGWTLELAGEPPSPFDLSSHDPSARADRARADGLERVLVAPSTPLGIEALPAREAQPLLAHPGSAAGADGPSWWPAMTSQNGSDRPVVDPPSLAILGPAFRHAVTRVNPAQVLS